jgi:hypothetical protein
MSSRYRSVYIGTAVILLVGLIAGGVAGLRHDGDTSQSRLMRALSGFTVEQAPADKLKIHSPLDETLFPADIVAPTFRWADSLLDTDSWGLVFDFQDGGTPLRFLSDQKEWTPD